MNLHDSMANKMGAGNSSYGICRVIKASRSPRRLIRDASRSYAHPSPRHQHQPNMNTSSRITAILAAVTLTVQISSAQNATPEITDLDQTLAEVPRDLLLAVRSGARKEPSATQATDILRNKVEGRTATLKFKVDKVEKYQRKNEKVDRYRIKAEDLRLRESVTNLKGYLWVHLDPSQNPKVSTIKKGNEISVTGKVSLATITANNNPELHIDLSDAKIN
jgi:hypothetical protein